MLTGPDQAGLMARWERAVDEVMPRLAGGYGYLDAWEVTPATTGGTGYIVSARLGCSCPDFSRAPGGWCKHRIAAWLKDGQEIALREHGSYPDWVRDHTREQNDRHAYHQRNGHSA